MARPAFPRASIRVGSKVSLPGQDCIAFVVQRKLGTDQVWCAWDDAAGKRHERLFPLNLLQVIDEREEKAERERKIAIKTAKVVKQGQAPPAPPPDIPPPKRGVIATIELSKARFRG